MPRTTPPDRLEKVLAVAAAAFVHHGFQRTQMDDIALGLGVSKGTLYRSVESKEALLAAVLTYADTPDRLPTSGPLSGIALRDLSPTLREELARSVSGLEVAAVTTRPSPADVGAEVETIVRDLFAMMTTHRVRIMVLDRCAAEVPELAGEWYESGRYAVVDLWADYLAARSSDIRSPIDGNVLARTIVELVTLWAVKMPWDPAPRPYPQDMAALCAVMIRNLLTGDQP